MCIITLNVCICVWESVRERASMSVCVYMCVCTFVSLFDSLCIEQDSQRWDSGCKTARNYMSHVASLPNKCLCRSSEPVTQYTAASQSISVSKGHRNTINFVLTLGGNEAGDVSWSEKPDSCSLSMRHFRLLITQRRRRIGGGGHPASPTQTLGYIGRQE